MKETLTWVPRLIAFAAWYAKEMAVSNIAVLRDNLTPGQDSTPGVGRIETECATEFEITLLAALISLTPGTLTLGTETSEGGRILLVHSMYHADADALRSDIAVMERHMLAAIRREGVSA